MHVLFALGSMDPADVGTFVGTKRSDHLGVLCRTRERESRPSLSATMFVMT
jgi:hypothetical protein